MAFRYAMTGSQICGLEIDGLDNEHILLTPFLYGSKYNLISHEISPWLSTTFNTIKLETRTVYNTHFEWITFFSELGRLISLEVSSKNLQSMFADVESADAIITTMKNNRYDQYTGKFVSYGDLSIKTMPSSYLTLFSQNRKNDLTLTPSLVDNQGRILHPVRWTKYGSTFTNYNSSLIYIDEAALKKRRIIHIGSRVFNELPVKFIMLNKSGRLRYSNSIIHIEPYEEIEKLKSGYFSWTGIGLNLGGTTLNLVEGLEDAYSKYRILPFIFPNIIKELKAEPEKLIFNFRIEKQIWRSVLSHLMDRDKAITVLGIESSDDLEEKTNKLMRITESANDFEISIINPVLIPFLIKQYSLRKEQTSGDSKTITRRIDKFFSSRDMVCELENISSSKYMNDELILLGIDPFTRARYSQLQCYGRVWDYFIEK